MDPFDGIGDLRRGVLRAVGDPAERFARTPCAWCGPCASPRGWAWSWIRRRRRPSPRTPPRSRRCPANASATSCCACWRASPPAAPPSAALALMERLGCCRCCFPSWRRCAASRRRRPCPATRWTTRCAPSMRCRPIGRRCGWRACCTTWARRRPWRTATSSVMTSRAPAWRRGPATPAIARTDAARIVRLVRQHMFAYTPRLDRCRRAPVRPPRGIGPARRPVRAARRRQRRQRRPRAGHRGDRRAARAGGAGAGQRRAGAGPAGDRRQRPGRRAGAGAGATNRGAAGPVAGRGAGRPVAEHQGAAAGPGAVLAVRARCLRAPPGRRCRDLEGADDGPAATIGDPGAVPTLALRPSPTRRISAP